MNIEYKYWSLRTNFATLNSNSALHILNDAWSAHNQTCSPIRDYRNWESSVKGKESFRWLTLGSFIVLASFAVSVSILTNHETDYQVLIQIVRLIESLSLVTVGIWAWTRFSISKCKLWEDFQTDTQELQRILPFYNFHSVEELMEKAKDYLVSTAQIVLTQQAEKNYAAEKNWRSKFEWTHKLFLKFGLVEENWATYFKLGEKVLASN